MSVAFITSLSAFVYAGICAPLAGSSRLAKRLIQAAKGSEAFRQDLERLHRSKRFSRYRPERSAMGRVALSPLVLLCLIGFSPARANDSIAEIKTGGLVLTRTDAISMDGEQLFISLNEIRVAYRFRNGTGKNIESTVAFPMPDVRFDPYEDTALPNLNSNNFLDFSVTIEGRPVAAKLEQRAFVSGHDVTPILRAHRIPLFPLGKAASDALATLPAATIEDWVRRGIVYMDRYDVGDGMKDHPTPHWTLKSSYWWRMTFPARRTIMVEHRYRPSVGGTVGVTFFERGKFGGPAYRDYRQRYCIDRAFEAAILSAMKRRGKEYPPFTENRISYVLRTANNWKGPIGLFSVTIDKGNTKNLVSFCGHDVRRLTPTIFEMTIRNFHPQKDLDVLFLRPAGW